MRRRHERARFALHFNTIEVRDSTVLKFGCERPAFHPPRLVSKRLDIVRALSRARTPPYSVRLSMENASFLTARQGRSVRALGAVDPRVGPVRTALSSRHDASLVPPAQRNKVVIEEGFIFAQPSKPAPFSHLGHTDGNASSALHRELKPAVLVSASARDSVPKTHRTARTPSTHGPASRRHLRADPALPFSFDPPLALRSASALCLPVPRALLILPSHRAAASPTPRPSVNASNRAQSRLAQPSQAHHLRADNVPSRAISAHPHPSKPSKAWKPSAPDFSPTDPNVSCASLRGHSPAGLVLKSTSARGSILEETTHERHALTVNLRAPRAPALAPPAQPPPTATVVASCTALGGVPNVQYTSRPCVVAYNVEADGEDDLEEGRQGERTTDALRGVNTRHLGACGTHVGWMWVWVRSDRTAQGAYIGLSMAALSVILRLTVFKVALSQTMSNQDNKPGNFHVTLLGGIGGKGGQGAIQGGSGGVGEGAQLTINSPAGKIVIQGDRLTEILQEWLAPPNMSDRQYELKRQHHESTGSWLLEDYRYEKWETTPGSLWINGICK
ncbi:hypothetical protein MSAN_00227300 [Mycena sanguinolenta]|uniref:Uncharacterized protein n=1 Tax=Mycena sanguinolenta TaxID=230812 RepID=A0A8H6ZIM8_9AGAR|nr:hypothetical protein MSAN_00227300 [Mycena sanguinolenta]